MASQFFQRLRDGLARRSGRRLEKALNHFTFRTYRQVVDCEGNQILSPFSIATGLHILLAGARGNTAREIQRVLQRSGAACDSEMGLLLRSLTENGNSPGNELRLVNGFWLQKGYSIGQAFENVLAETYQASTTRLDFESDPEAARLHINRWTEEQTKGKIRNLLPAGSMGGLTRMALTSAIYFYGKWELPFDSNRTREAPFTLSSGTQVWTNFMFRTAQFSYARIPQGELLEMAYAGSGIVFDVILPSPGRGPHELEKLLSADKLLRWIARLNTRRVKVMLPKFRVESQVTLSQALCAMGIRDAFTDRADFSGVSSEKALAVNPLVHKALIEVSEKGTEAAASTGMTYLGALPGGEQVLEFRADRPFLYLIRDSRSQVILFLGRLMNPR